MKLALTLLFFTQFAVATDADNSQNLSIRDIYEKEKDKILATDEKSRITMGRLYQINQRMKVMSRKRNNLTDKLLISESRARDLTKKVIELEDEIKKQRHSLSKRLKAIYMLGDDTVARIIFSSASAQELDQTLKYLKKISENEYENIKNFEKNLKALNQSKEQMKAEVKNLLAVKAKLEKQEKFLTNEQLTKGELLNSLHESRRLAISKIQNIRTIAKETLTSEDLDISFFEKKGRLTPPASGVLARDFGLVRNSTYRYELSHKGLTYKLSDDKSVQTVHDGRVEFVGHVAGYGKTVIIDHGDYYYTVYANLRNTIADEHDFVSTGDTIASSESMLYFELRHFSDAIDPQPWFKKKKLFFDKGSSHEKN